MSRIDQIHNDYLDPDKHLWPDEPPEDYIAGHQLVLDFFSADDEKQCERYVYKYTECGAWISFHDWGIKLGSIVEGSDEGTETYELAYADRFTSADIQARIDAIEIESAAVWDWANTTYDKRGHKHPNGKTMAEQGIDFPDVRMDYQHLKGGSR